MSSTEFDPSVLTDDSMTPLRRAVLWASGANVRILRQVPSEFDAYGLMGSAVWLSATIAAIGGTLAAGVASRGSPSLEPQYLLAGILVGALVFWVDRALVRMPLNPFHFPQSVLAAFRSPVSEQQFIAALAALDEPAATTKAAQLRSIIAPLLLRMTIAVCTSFIVANFVLFLLFAPDIKNRAVYITQTTRGELIADTNRTFDAREARLRARLATLNGGGGKLAHARKSVAGLNRQLSTTNGDITTLHAAYLSEIHGDARTFVLSTGKRIYTSSFAGKSGTADSILSDIADLQKQRGRIDGEIAGATKILRLAQEDALRQKHANAGEIASLNAKIEDLEHQRDAALTGISSGTPQGSGLLLQYEALAAIENDTQPLTQRPDPPTPCKSWACSARRFLVPPTPLGSWVAAFRILALLIDLLPILIKTHLSLRERRPYDARVAAYAELEVAETFDFVHRELLRRRVAMDMRVERAMPTEPNAA